jgi:ABC-type polysaccharide/polyol phosphate export permease
MRERSNIFLVLLGMGIIIIGGIIPNLPHPWISELPAWIKYISILCGVALILMNFIWFFQDIDGLLSKKKNKVK